MEDIEIINKKLIYNSSLYNNKNEQILVQKINELTDKINELVDKINKIQFKLNQSI